MTSKISLSKLIREDLRHRTWQIVLSFLVQLLFGPLALMLAISTTSYSSYYTTGENEYRTVASFFGSYYSMILVIIAFVGALIVALAGYNYLFSRRMTDLYHSVPVSRTRLFFSKYLTGLLVWAVPALCGFLVTFLIAMTRIGFSGIGGRNLEVWARAFRALAGETFSFFAIYHLLLLAIMLSGTIFNTLVNTVLLGFDAAITYGIFYMICDNYFDTFVDPCVSFQNVAWLSQPIAAGAIAGIEVFELGPVFLIGSFAVMILNLVLAVILNKKRASEQAETGVELKPLAAFLRILNTILAGILGGIALAFLTDDNVVWILIGIVLASVLTYGIIDIIHQRAFRAFFSHKVIMAICVASTILIYLCIRGDWIGYDTYLPMRSNITSANLVVRNFMEPYGLTFDEQGFPQSYDYRNSYVVDSNEGTHVTDADSIYQLLESATAYEEVRTGKYDAPDFVAGMYITVNRRLRCDYTRFYQLQGDAIPALKKIIETDSYREANYPASSGLYPMPDYITLSDASYSDEDLLGTDMDMLLETYYREFREQYSFELLSSYVQVGRIELYYYRAPGGESSYRGTFDVELPIYSTFTDTIALAEKLCPDLLMSVSRDDLAHVTIRDYIAYSEDMGNMRDVVASYYGLEGFSGYQYPENSESYIQILPAYDEEFLRRISPYAVPGWTESSGSHFNNDYICIGYFERDYYSDCDVYVPRTVLEEAGWLDQLYLYQADSNYSGSGSYYDPYPDYVDEIYYQ